METLERETNSPKLAEENMIANLGKFNAIVITKDKKDTRSDISSSIQNDSVSSEKSLFRKPLLKVDY